MFLGYTSAKAAKEMGLTHHASYYGLPMYYAQDGSDGMKGMAKWSPLDALIPVIASIEGFIRSTMFPEDEPVFQFKILGKL